MRYIIKIGRMQMLNRWVFIGVPLMILAIVLAMVFLIGAVLVPGNQDFYTGAGQAPMWYFFGVGIQALTLTFPFSQGMSVTRRNFYLGTMITFLLLSLAFALLFFGLALIEQATGGWFVHAVIFTLPWMVSGPWYGTVLMMWAMTFLLFSVGFCGATIYKRWGVTGLMIAGLALSVVLVAVAALITWTASWSAIWEWGAEQTPLTGSGVIAIVIAVLAAGSYAVLRRATP